MYVKKQLTYTNAYIYIFLAQIMYNGLNKFFFQTKFIINKTKSIKLKIKPFVIP